MNKTTFVDPSEESIVVVPSFSRVGTPVVERVSRTAYQKLDLLERLDCLSIEDAKIMALTAYYDPILTTGSNDGELVLKGWSREVCMPCNEDTVLDVLSTLSGEKLVVATLHTCAYLRSNKCCMNFSPWGSIKVSPPTRSGLSLQTEAREVFAKIERVIGGRSIPVPLWNVVVDDLTRLLMVIRTSPASRSDSPVECDREASPQMCVDQWDYIVPPQLIQPHLENLQPRALTPRERFFLRNPDEYYSSGRLNKFLRRIDFRIDSLKERCPSIISEFLEAIWSFLQRHPHSIAMFYYGTLGASAAMIVKRSVERAGIPQMERLPGMQTVRNVSETFERAPKALAKIDAAATQLTQLGLNLNQIIDSVKNWGATTSDFMSADMICLFLDLIRECLQTHPIGMTTLAIRFCRLFNIVEFEKSAITYLTSLWSYYTSAPVTQLDETGVEERVANPNGAGEVLAALVALVGMGVCRNLYTDKAGMRVTEALRAVNLCVPAGRNIASMLAGISSVLPACVGAWFEEMCPEQLWLQAFREEEVEEWMHATQEFCVESNKLLLVHDAEMQFKLSTLKAMGERISQKLSCIARSAPGMYNRILRRLELVDDFVRHLAVVTGVVDSKRPVPFCVYLFGEPGIGKSVATEAILEALVPDEIPKRLRAYSRVPGSDYFDGYLCQYAVVMDDYAQSADGSDALDLIRMVNSTNYMPPMASLDNASIGVKATPFTSRLLVISSNVGYPTSQQVVKQPAVWRRRHYLLECKVKAQYATLGLLDMTKVPLEVAAKLGHIEWIRRDPLDARIPGKSMETIEMLLDLRRRFTDHTAHMERLMKGGLFTDLLKGVKEREAAPQMECVVHNRKANVRTSVQSVEAIAAISEHVTEETGLETDIDFFSACDKTDIVSAHEAGNLTEDEWHQLFRQPLVRASYRKLKAGTQSVADGYKCLRMGVSKFVEEHPWVSSCIAGVGVAAAIFGAVAFAWSSHSSGDPIPNMANPSPGDLKNEATSVRFRKRTVAPLRKANANGEGLFSFDGSAVDPEGNKWVELLSKNMVYLRVHNPIDDTAFGMGGFVLRNRTVILPYHFFCPSGQLVEPGRQMSVAWSGKETRFLFNPKSLRRFPETDDNGRLRDLACYELPVTVAPFKDRSLQVVNDDYLERMHRKPGFMLSMRSNQLHITLLPDIKVSQITTAYSVGNTRFATPVTLEYTAATQVGDCGALILVSDPAMQARIVGIHVASYKNFGIADFLTSVELSYLDSVFPSQGDRSPVIPQMCQEGKAGKFTPRGDFTILGTVPRAFASRMADSTHIKESDIHDLAFEHETEPAALNPSDIRINPDIRGKSIIVKAVEKFGAPSGPFDPIILDQAVDFYSDMFVSPDTIYPRRVLTLDEAVNGIDGLKYMDALCMKSSAGFGFRKPGSPGKGHLFEQQAGRYHISSQDLLAAIDFRSFHAKHATRVQSIWTDSLKDERRPMKKIWEAKTRAFCIPPVTIHYLCVNTFCHFVLIFTHFISRASVGWAVILNRPIGIFSPVNCSTRQPQCLIWILKTLMVAHLLKF